MTVVLVILLLSSLWIWPVVGVTHAWRLRAERGALVLRPHGMELVNEWPFERPRYWNWPRVSVYGGYTETMSFGSFAWTRDLEWLPHVVTFRLSNRLWIEEVTLPLWIPTAVACGASLLCRRQDALARRRAGAGRCVKCHYDRSGLAAGAVCPECGCAEVAA